MSQDAKAANAAPAAAVHAEAVRAAHDAPVLAVIAFTRKGCELALTLAAGLRKLPEYEDAALSVSGPSRFADELGIAAYESLGAWTGKWFGRADALLFVSATGIAVRAIAPYVRDKFHDPAVVSVDEAGSFVVPLLSGHVGGANALARAVARITAGQAVVSTATDVNGLFAVDEWAARRGFRIVERALAKQISARLLEGGSVGFYSDFELDWDPPQGVVPAESQGAPSDLGFVVSLDDGCQPFACTLHLVPHAVALGVGCRRNTATSVLAGAVDAALDAAGVSPLAVSTLASIDVKADEPALHELAGERGWDLKFYTADQLAAVPGQFAGSDFVKRTVGVDNVCERAALAQGGRLLLGKQAADGVTVAVAVCE